MYAILNLEGWIPDTREPNAGDCERGVCNLTGGKGRHQVGRPVYPNP